MKLAVILACILTTTALAEDVDKPAAELPDRPSSNTLGKVDAETTADATTVNIRFKEDLDWQSVTMSDHGTFIQIEMPQTIVPNPGDFMEGAGDHLKKMAVFQITPHTGALRLFVANDALLVKNSLKTDILGNRIMVTIDHNKLASLIANDPKETAAPETAASAEEVIAKTSVDNTLAPPAERTKAQVAEIEEPAAAEEVEAAAAPAAVAGSGVFNFQDKLISVSVFLGVLLVGLMIFLVMAPKIRKARFAMNTKEEFTMRSLATHTVAPKQKVELIDVGGQQVLIGVTPGNINFLTTINPAASSQAVAQPQIQPKQIAQPQPRAIAQSSTIRPSQKAAQRPATNPAKQKVASAYGKPQPGSNDTINDVTKLIREKLKNIPSV